MKKDPSYAEAVANMLVLTAVSGKNVEEITEYVCLLLCVDAVLTVRYRTLKKTDPKHAFLTDLEEKSALFDKAATKYSVKVPG